MDGSVRTINMRSVQEVCVDAADVRSALGGNATCGERMIAASGDPFVLGHRRGFGRRTA
jgi:hypothetical protein